MNVELNVNKMGRFLGEGARVERERELEAAVLRLQGAVTSPPAERCD